MHVIILNRHHNAGSILIDAVNDTGSDNAVDIGKIALAVSEQRIDQSLIMMTRAGMNYHALRLIDNDEIIILIKNIKRDILSYRLI